MHGGGCKTGFDSAHIQSVGKLYKSLRMTASGFRTQLETNDKIPDVVGGISELGLVVELVETSEAPIGGLRSPTTTGRTSSGSMTRY